MFELKGKYSTAKVMIDQVELECTSQIISMINHCAFVNPIAIMPDTHSGKGSVIGFTMLVGPKVIPNIVGVDIGCGMLSVNLGDIKLDCKEVDSAIRRAVPFGMEVHDRGVIHMKNDFPWKGSQDYEWFVAKCKQIGIDLSYAINSIGTLGGGNHFIEFGKAMRTGDTWLTVHTGSRNFGKRVCDYWQKVAAGTDDGAKKAKLAAGIEEIKRTAKNGAEIGQRISELKKSLNIQKKVTGLEYLESFNAAGYMEDMYFSQVYAKVNRVYIVHNILAAMGLSELGIPVTRDRIETIHNFIDPQDHIIRKGAVRSYAGEKMIIPLNPHDGTLICEGKSNPEWNFSAPHGAGRVMSRRKAKETISQEVADNAMEGVYASAKPIDESPLAYKDSSLIAECIEPTAKIIDRIIPFMNLKAGDGEE